MTVQELIDKLNKVENKSKEVYFYSPNAFGQTIADWIEEYETFIQIN